MLASNPARILEQISRRTGIALTQEPTSGDHALTCRSDRQVSEVAASHAWMNKTSTCPRFFSAAVPTCTRMRPFYR